eukprot:853938-Amphidinium_carterae.1
MDLAPPCEGPVRQVGVLPLAEAKLVMADIDSSAQQSWYHKRRQTIDNDFRRMTSSLQFMSLPCFDV